MTIRLSLKSALAGLAVMAMTAGGALADDLADIKAAGKITVATEMHYPSYDMLENGKYVGFDKDLFDEIAKELGVTPDYQDLPWTSILPGLEVKKFPFVLAPVTYTKERMERYAFTRPFSESTSAMAQRKGGDLKKPEDIKGKTVGAQKGTAQLAEIQAYAEKVGGATVKEYGSVDEAYADLVAGRIDAAVAAGPLLDYLAATRPDQFEVVRPAFGEPSYFGYVARKGDGDTLIAAVDDAIAKIIADGRMAKIQEKWFGVASELPAEKPKF